MKTTTRALAVSAAIVSGAAFAGFSASPAMAADDGYGGYGAPRSGQVSAPTQPFGTPTQPFGTPTQPYGAQPSGAQPFGGQPFSALPTGRQPTLGWPSLGRSVGGQPFVGGSDRLLSCGFVRSQPTLEAVVLHRLLSGNRHGHRHRWHHRSSGIERALLLNWLRLRTACGDTSVSVIDLARFGGFPGFGGLGLGSLGLGGLGVGGLGVGGFGAGSGGLGVGRRFGLPFGSVDPSGLDFGGRPGLFGSPGGAYPAGGYPGGANPFGTNPSGGYQNRGVPGQGLPRQGMPSQGLPRRGMPSQGLPGASGQGAPGQGAPGMGGPVQGANPNQGGYGYGAGNGNRPGIDLPRAGGGNGGPGVNGGPGASGGPGAAGSGVYGDDSDPGTPADEVSAEAGAAPVADVPAGAPASLPTEISLSGHSTASTAGTLPLTAAGSSKTAASGGLLAAAGVMFALFGRRRPARRGRHALR